MWGLKVCGPNCDDTKLKVVLIYHTYIKQYSRIKRELLLKHVQPKIALHKCEFIS